MSKRRTQAAAKPETVRCAIYTRKSTEEGLQQEFNSLDAQRESGEAYVKSQAHEGWQCLADRYDDGGFTGGNIDRPALRRLLDDIAKGKVNIVLVYKVDRLSRSLLDFAKLMATFEQHDVAFVSVTQQFSTASSMGRLMMNVLLSFAQFERELISERTRDKIAATRRKGKWAGGHPILGYDDDPDRFKLVVNEREAARVQTIFELYLDHQSLLPVVQELVRRGWRNKRWTTRKGLERGGKEFTRTSLYKLLTNVVYAGKIRYKDEIHQGEHAAIVELAIWQKVQAILGRNGRTGGAPVRNKFGAILKGLLRCAACDAAMTPSHTTRHGNKRYRYYTCSSAQKRGWQTCPSKSIPAGQIEQFVVDQIKCIGNDPAVVHETLAAAREQTKASISKLDTELRGLKRDLDKWNAEIRKLAETGPASDTATVSRLADLHERIRDGDRKSTEIIVEITMLKGDIVDEHEVASALEAFTPVWETLAPREQARIVQLLVQRIDYDGAAGKVAITFHPSGIKALAADSLNQPKEKVA